jgi:hypothetical protein
MVGARFEGREVVGRCEAVSGVNHDANETADNYLVL